MKVNFTFGDLPLNLGLDDEDLKNSIKKSRQYSAGWDAVAGCANLYSEHSNEAENLIEKFLGYLPFPTIYLPHEVFIRALIADRNNSAVTEDEFRDQINVHLINIRNDDMRIDGWIEDLSYSEKDFEYYGPFQNCYASMSRERLVQHLGYEPDLQHSLYAETYLRSLILLDTYTSDWPTTSFDKKAITVVKFREIFTSRGIEAANNSPLIEWKN